MEIDLPITFMKSPEGQRMLDKHNAEYREKHTPGPNNTCKEPGCNGKVVRRVASLSRGGFQYHQPACDKCRRRYGFAENAPQVGREDFERKMNQMYF